MKTLFPALALALTVMGHQALADDTNSDKPIKTHKQLMQECVAKHRAEDSSASLSDLQKACRAEIQSYQNHPSAIAPSQAPPT
jgi:hypothetical protein